MMNPTELKKIKEWTPLPLIITIIMFLAPSFIIAPQNENLSVIENSFDGTLKSIRHSLAQKEKDKQTLERQTLLEADLKRLDRWLPTEKNLPTLIERFNSLASLLSVKISSVNYGFAKDNEGISPPSVNIHFNLMARYGAMREYIQALECLPYPILLTEVTANNDNNFTISLVNLVKP